MLTSGGIKTEIQTRAVEVKVNGSATRPAEIGVSSGGSEAGSRAILTATCVKAAGWCRGHVSGSGDTGRRSGAGRGLLLTWRLAEGVADTSTVVPTSLKLDCVIVINDV